MLHHGVPERHLIVEVAFVGVAERAEAEKELVAVIGAAVKARAGGNRGGLGELPAGAGKPAEGVGEEKSAVVMRSEEHTSELQSPCNLVCRLLLEKKKKRH